MVGVASKRILNTSHGAALVVLAEPSTAAIEARCVQMSAVVGVARARGR